MAEEVHDQHFVPVFYLRRFVAGEELRVSTLSLEHRKIKGYGPRQIGQELYFYALRSGRADAISQELEAWLTKQEALLSPGYTQAADLLRDHGQLTAEQRTTIARVMGMLYARGKGLRDTVARMAEGALSLETQIVNDLLVSAAARGTRLRVEDGWEEEVSGPLDNRYHLPLVLQAEDFAMVFARQHWTVVVADEPLGSFVTSDNPVSSYGPSLQRGTPLDQKTHYFTLDPQVCLQVCPRSEERSRDEFVRLVEGDGAVVQGLNEAIACRALNFVFARGREALEALPSAAHAS